MSICSEYKDSKRVDKMPKHYISWIKIGYGYFFVYRTASSPIGPVAGGIMAFFLLLALTAWGYRHWSSGQRYALYIVPYHPVRYYFLLYRPAIIFCQ